MERLSMATSLVIDGGIVWRANMLFTSATFGMSPCELAPNVAATAFLEISAANL